jgi:hypothetical protein
MCIFAAAVALPYLRCSRHCQSRHGGQSASAKPSGRRGPSKDLENTS